MPNYGLRKDGTPKGQNGWLGTLRRPDGNVSNELSLGVNIDGKEQLIPTMVPTLLPEQLKSLLNGEPITSQIQEVAVQHAIKMLRKGRSPFFD